MRRAVSFVVAFACGFTVVCRWTAYYCEKIRVFQADVYLNSSAWNNGIGEVALLLVWVISDDE